VKEATRQGNQDSYTSETAAYLIVGMRSTPNGSQVLHEQAMDHRQRGGENALRFV